MTELEKTIKGIEYCLNADTFKCGECPYDEYNKSDNPDNFIYNDDCIGAMLKDARDFLKQLKFQNDIKWHDTKQDSPKEPGRYLVVEKSIYKNMPASINIAYYTTDLGAVLYDKKKRKKHGWFRGDSEGDWEVDVLYWMLLPEPPKDD